MNESDIDYPNAKLAYTIIQSLAEKSGSPERSARADGARSGRRRGKGFDQHERMGKISRSQTRTRKHAHSDRKIYR